MTRESRNRRRAPGASIRGRTTSDWWKGFFGEDYLLMYGRALTPQLSADQVEGVVRMLRLRSDEVLLDLCCGFGRHLRWFRSRGIEAFGLDRSEVQMSNALPTDRRRMVLGDVRVIPFGCVFDAVVLLYTSFGYFDEEGNRRQLAEAFRVLKAGGRLLIDNQNPPAYLRSLQRVRRASGGVDGTVVTEEFDFDAKSRRLHSRKEVATPEAVREHFFALRTYDVDELTGILQGVGFEVFGAYGDYDGRDYSTETRRLIVVAGKPA